MRQRVGVLGLCCLLFSRACTCRGIFGAGQLFESVSNGLARASFSICSSKRKKKNFFFNFQHGIFPVILNKFHLFVPGIQIRITSLAQMQIQSHKRNIDTNCNHTSPSLMRSNALAAVRAKWSI